MGFFGKVLSATIKTTLLPVDAVKDVATLGGLNTNRDESYTGEKLKDIKKTLDKAMKDLEY